jgi:hypothetical protein
MYDNKLQFRLWIIAKRRITNLPNHFSPQIRDVALMEIEGVFTPRKCFEELAGEDTAVEPILLLRCVLFVCIHVRMIDHRVVRVSEITKLEGRGLPNQ